MAISLDKPDLQVDFAAALIQARVSCLQEVLFESVRNLPIPQLDRELSRFAPARDLALLASKGLRGEIIFCAPMLLRQNPKLIGYYRLLLGYSQKEFYNGKTGMGAFQWLEKKGLLSSKCEEQLPDLCRLLNSSASYLLNGIPSASLQASFLDDLTLLTLGPQLRGGANVKKGARGIVLVFNAIHEIVQDHIIESSPRAIMIVNAARRKVSVEFAPDPDIIIREGLDSSREFERKLIAIEVKGGTDYSNLHNRIGEAEKSHQKAKARGYTECWTIVNIDHFDLNKLKRESPSTNIFYRLASLAVKEGEEFEDFSSRIISLTGIPTPAKSRKKK